MTNRGTTGTIQGRQDRDGGGLRNGMGRVQRRTGRDKTGVQTSTTSSGSTSGTKVRTSNPTKRRNGRSTNGSNRTSRCTRSRCSGQRGCRVHSGPSWEVVSVHGAYASRSSTRDKIHDLPGRTTVYVLHLDCKITPCICYRTICVHLFVSLYY